MDALRFLACFNIWAIAPFHRFSVVKVCNHESRAHAHASEICKIDTDDRSIRANRCCTRLWLVLWSCIIGARIRGARRHTNAWSGWQQCWLIVIVKRRQVGLRRGRP